MAISLDATLQMRQRSYNHNLALDGCVACVRAACTQTSRFLDPTSVHLEHILLHFFACLLPSTHCTFRLQIQFYPILI